MPKLLVFDTETGGLDAQIHSILSLGAVVWDDGQLMDTFEELIEEPDLVAEPGALEINRINLEQHRLHSVPPVEVMARFTSFLGRNFDRSNGDRISLVGHNVGFDVSFLRRLCRLAGVAYDDLFSHRVLDTAGITRFLILAGKLPLTGAGSTEAFEYFKIPIQTEKRHSALEDAKATAVLLNCLIDVARRPGTRIEQTITLL